MAYLYYNPNPCKVNVGDCAIRALSKALNVSWKEAYRLACEKGYEQCDMPSSDAVTSTILQQNGFRKSEIPFTRAYTIQEFCRDNPFGLFVIYTGGHVVTVEDGNIYDLWDSSKLRPFSVWYYDERPNYPM